jgi:hypothetical protein
MHDFNFSNIWGDPHVTTTNTALLPTTAMAKDLIGKNVTLVSQLWDTAAASWHPVTIFFPIATQQISTAYNRLLSQLKPPSSYLLVHAHFSAFEFNFCHYVQDYSKPSRPSFFWWNPTTSIFSDLPLTSPPHHWSLVPHLSPSTVQL